MKTQKIMIFGSKKEVRGMLAHAELMFENAFNLEDSIMWEKRIQILKEQLKE